MFNMTEANIMKHWDSSELLVSICSTTYNHETFIEKALDGFLMQETSFPFEIIVRDDCSTDRTAQIIKQYAKKYPRIIKTIFEKKNMYSNGMRRPMKVAHKKAMGKYIATCEGDDFWTDIFKLQKQIDFLECNPQYSISYHDVNIIDKEGLITSKTYSSEIKDYSSDEMLTGDALILTSTAVYRNIGLCLFPRIFDNVANGDMTIWHMLGKYGKGKFQSEINNSCYRIHTGGIWSSIKKEERITRTMDTLYLIKKNISPSEKQQIFRVNTKLQELHSQILLSSLKETNYDILLRNFYIIVKSIKYKSISILEINIHYLFLIIIRTIKNMFSVLNIKKLPLKINKLGSRRTCNICNNSFSNFIPYRDGSKQSGFIKDLRIIGSDIENFSCPYCFSHDRERHLFMYINNLSMWDNLKNKTLHFAPETQLSKKIKSLSPIEYIKADLYPTEDDIKIIDITNIDYPNNYFDFLICNHVLEHIKEIKKALNEIHRVLNIGGLAILQTPYSSILHNSFTDENINTNSMRRTYYGQEDHVRVFGSDFFTLLEEAGFQLNIKTHKKHLTNIDAQKYGMNEAEDLILVEKLCR